MTHVSITILVGVQEERMRAGKMISELNRSLEVSRRGGEDLFDQVITNYSWHLLNRRVKNVLNIIW